MATKTIKCKGCIVLFAKLNLEDYTTTMDDITSPEYANILEDANGKILYATDASGNVAIDASEAVASETMSDGTPIAKVIRAYKNSINA